MAKVISKTQIDRLGDRLKQGLQSEEDLLLLDQYRGSYLEALDLVVGAIRNRSELEPASRRSKTLLSITQKLRRESLRLTQMQDIAGCRIVVQDLAGQDTTVQLLKTLFDDISIIDRRQYPSHGYRAVHAIVPHHEKPVEIQLRTLLQHLWAELSEKLADAFGQAIKYGGGDETIQAILAEASSMVAGQESAEAELVQLQAASLSVETKSGRLQTVQSPLPEGADLSTQPLAEQLTVQVAEAEARLESARRKMSDWFREAIRQAEKMRGKNDLPD